jgi:glycosyltransferase involved in cell wall biosynthesis
MSLRVLYTGRFRRGTPAADIEKMVHYNHPEVEFIQYTPKEKGDVILGIHNSIPQDKSSKRKVMFIGSIPTLRKRDNRNAISKLDHTLFISDFCQKVFLSMFDFKSYSTFLPVGGMPADYDLEPTVGKRIIDGPIKFVAVAKWYKRPYKRKDQIIELYRDYLRKEYSDSELHIIGSLGDKVEDGVHFHKKSFGNNNLVDFIKSCHVHIIPTPFDEGPHTIPESLHYRVPFVCSNNCCGKEYIDKLGQCGIVVETEKTINNWKDYKSLKPLDYRSKFVRNKIPFEEYSKAVKTIVNNFEKYTSWSWNEKLNYKLQSDILYNILKGK